MIEERKNGGNENGPDDSGPQRNEYGEPQFAPPGPGERLDQTTAPPGQPMPGLDEGPGGDVSGAERPAASPRRQAKRGKRKSGAKAKSARKRGGARKAAKKGGARAGAKKKGGKKRASAGRRKASGKRRGSSKRR